MKVFAVSAPHHKSLVGPIKSFDSTAPFSLQNAMRLSAWEAKHNTNSKWYSSNYHHSDSREYSTFLMHSWEEDKDEFIARFNHIEPDILFIGCMTLSFPGAIKVAEYCRKLRPKKTLVVLGGKHVNETVFIKDNVVRHHIGSPLLLMSSSRIPDLFDIVVSGKSESVILEIGESIDGLDVRDKRAFEAWLKVVHQNAKGDYILGYLNETGAVSTLVGSNTLDYSDFPFCAQIYRPSRGFRILGRKDTYQTYSDISLGCIYACFFCSEKSSINGKIRLKSLLGVQRLLNQFKFINNVDDGDCSIFVEDSIFLMGIPNHISDFISECQNAEICIPFGCQMTFDIFLYLTDETIDGLRSIGLRYIAFGVETLEESIATKFSKNTSSEMWSNKLDEIVERCARHHINVGMFLIWGLGENQRSRIFTISTIIDYMKKYEIAIDVGYNIATQHPLQMTDSNKGKLFDYLQWGTPTKSPYHPYLTTYFGEASLRYCISPEDLPSVKDLDDLIPLMEQLKELTVLKIESYEQS